jgi:hypothetical protein
MEPLSAKEVHSLAAMAIAEDRPDIFQKVR